MRKLSENNCVFSGEAERKSEGKQTRGTRCELHRLVSRKAGRRYRGRTYEVESLRRDVKSDYEEPRHGMRKV